VLLLANQHLTVGVGLLVGPSSSRVVPELEAAPLALLVELPVAALRTLATLLGFDHPVTGEPLRFETPPPPDFARALEALRPAQTP